MSGPDGSSNLVSHATPSVSGLGSKTGAASSLKPVFLVAPMNRSGTKFLKSLLLAHPRITQGFALEDYSLAYVDRLLDYGNLMSRHWGRGEDERVLHRERFVEEARVFLLNFFRWGAGDGDHLLLTTPRPWGIEHAFRLFPDARLIFVVRDGRDCVESARKSFTGSSFRDWVREWRRGAEEVLRFAATHESSRGTRWEAVRFEDLVSGAETIGRRLCAFLGIDPDDADWRAAAEGPIRGSSEHGGPSHLAPKTSAFNPVGRSTKWSLLERLQFRVMAGAANDALARLCPPAR